MSAAANLRRARAAYGRRAWSDCYAALTEADRTTALSSEDVELYATVAFLTGRLRESTDLWTRAHSQCLGNGDVARAARCAVRLGMDLLNAGERVRGGGWIDKARRLLEAHPSECVEHGYVLLPEAIQQIMMGDAASAHATFEKAADIGRRFQDADLVTMARHGMGRALIREGKVRDGLTLLDEAMVALEAGEVSPAFAGDIYCSVIEASLEVFDVRRAREWTTALSHWCEAQPDLVPYTGQCLVRRAEIMQLHGDWSAALESARKACEHFLRGPEQPAIAAAYYQQAELRRLRGDYVGAEECYREAARRGRQAQPGLALMRLAQGQAEAAATGVRAALEQTRGRAARCRLLPACIEIMLDSKDVESARAASDELTQIAESLDAPMLLAAAAHAQGSIALATGDARAALTALRRAWDLWQDMDVPYEGARARVLIGVACRELGDHDAAQMELDGAHWVFQQLAAEPDAGRARALSGKRRGADGPLTEREVQVLRLIAAGLTNRVIAGSLEISEKTVARHVSNIFTKLGLSTRAAATAYAYQHGLA